MGSLTPAEESLLLATASRIFPKHADLVVSNLCGSTSAEITTQKIADRPDGRVQEHERPGQSENRIVWITRSAR
jgi:hypothetical protein